MLNGKRVKNKKSKVTKVSVSDMQKNSFLICFMQR